MSKPEITDDIIDGRRVLDPAAPYEAAGAFVADRYLDDAERPLLWRTGGDFYRWDGAAYTPAETEDLRAELYDYLNAATRRVTEGRGEGPGGRVEKIVPFNPRKRHVDELLDALAAEARAGVAVPAWLPGAPADAPDPAGLIVARNGWLDPDRPGVVNPPDPRLLRTAALDCDLDADPPAPTAWLAFLDSLGLDAGERGLLREFAGYLLTADTRQQKALLIVGPRRSGKGTIGRMLAALVGAAGTCAPTLGGLATNFGLAPLIGRRLALVADARLSGRTDQGVVTERLLSIIGEDAQTVDRKHRAPVTLKLAARFVILTNELPKLADASGALSGRMLVLPLRTSFYGREDHGLTARLLGELPGILAWALGGLSDLRRRGRFVQPGRGAEMQAEMDDLASPAGAFVRDRCRVGAGLSIAARDLYRAYCRWREDAGNAHHPNEQTFGRDLRAAVAGIDMTRPRRAGQRVREYEGIDLNDGGLGL